MFHRFEILNEYVASTANIVSFYVEMQHKRHNYHGGMMQMITNQLISWTVFTVKIFMGCED